MKTYIDSAVKSLCEAIRSMGEFSRYDDYMQRGLPENGSISYGSHNSGRLGDIDWDCLFTPSYFTYSDYSGSTVERSNCDVFIEKYGENPGVYELYGDYGTRGVAVKLSAITPEMIEEFQALSDYPLMDEEHHSNLEFEMEQEAWGDWISGDFRRDLAKMFPDHEEEIDEMDEAKLFDLFRERMEKTNTYYVHEDAVSVWVNIDDLLEGMTAKDLA